VKMKNLKKYVKVPIKLKVPNYQKKQNKIVKKFKKASGLKKV